MGVTHSENTPPAQNQTQTEDLVVQETQAGITTFVDDGQVREVKKEALDLPLQNVGVAPHFEPSIKAFMERPIAIETGLWTTASTAGTILEAEDIAPNLEAQTMWTRKLEGFNLIRGKAKVKVVINANPFQQGRLLIHYLPCYSHINASMPSYPAIHNLNLTQMTQQPCVELDCRDASAEIEIPYITPSNWYDRAAGHYDWGRVYLTVLSPLNVGSGGTTSVEYTMFLSFDDFEFAAPTYNAQGPPHVRNASVVRGKDRKYVKYTAQGPADGEALRDAGPVESFANGVTYVANALSDVPFLGAFAQPVAAISSVVSGVASIFGWSKHLEDKPAMPVIQRPFRNMCNMDGAATSEIYALTGANRLAVLPGFAGTDLDEMSFAFLKKIPAFISSFSWAVTDVTTTNLFTLPIAPSAFLAFGTITNGSYDYNYSYGPPFTYLSNLFRHYRGDIELTFKFIKTDYHTGRIVIHFDPVDASTTYGQSIYQFREIIDLRTSSEVTFRVPFLKAFEYLNVNEPLGTITMDVVNELRVPQTAAQSIQVLVYANAADNFELQIPRDSAKVPFCAQGPRDGVNSRTELVSKPIGNAPAPSSININDSASCIGEHFLSIKQLLNSSRRFQIPTVTDSELKNDARIWPFGIGLCKSANAVEPTFGNFLGDYLSYLAPGYVFSRGGIRLHYALNGANGSMDTNMIFDSSSTPFVVINSSVDGSLTNGNNYGPISLTANRNNLGFETVFTSNNGSTTDVMIPHYGRTPVRLNYCQTDNADTLPFLPDVPRTLIQNKNIGSIVDTNSTVYRSTADDYQLGFFIGFPPLLETITSAE